MSRRVTAADVLEHKAEAEAYRLPLLCVLVDARGFAELDLELDRHCRTPSTPGAYFRDVDGLVRFRIAGTPIRVTGMALERGESIPIYPLVKRRFGV